jgi:hypothetical protein
MIRTYPSIDSHSKIIINKPGSEAFTVRQHDTSNATRYINNMPKDVYNEPLTTVEELNKTLNEGEEGGNSTADNTTDAGNSTANSTGNATTDGA